MAAKFGEEVGGNSIMETVAQQISTLNPRVEEQVVDVLVEREIKKRSEAVIILIDKIDGFERDLKKNKPDLVALDETGKTISENFTRKQLDARNKLKSQIKKYQDAINKALIEKDFSNVYQLANEKAGAPDKSGKDKDEGGSED